MMTSYIFYGQTKIVVILKLLMAQDTRHIHALCSALWGHLFTKNNMMRLIIDFLIIILIKILAR